MKPTPPHGTRRNYCYYGCRCFWCRLANTDYQTRRRQRVKAEGSLIVPANKARAHVWKLSRSGVGRRALGDAADLDSRTIWRIRTGRTKRIYKATEAAILQVDSQALADRVLVEAGPTWHRLDALIERGYTKTQLARFLGYKTGALQFPRNRITARNACRVERLAQRIDEGRCRRE